MNRDEREALCKWMDRPGRWIANEPPRRTAAKLQQAAAEIRRLVKFVEWTEENGEHFIKTAAKQCLEGQE